MKSIILIIALSLVVASEAKGDIKSINKDNVIKPEIAIPVEDLKNCFPYVNNYGFYEPWQKCESQCCGGCLKRYCCNNPAEIILYQEKCENNEFIQSGNYPQKNPVCYSFIDRYDNTISEEKCEEGKFCSGTCSNRYCGQSEQHWLDQDKCQNNIGVRTTQVDTLPTEVETTSQSTDRPRFPTTTDSIEPLFRINYYAILTMLVILILFIMVITLLFKLNRMDQLLRRYRQQEQLTLRIRFDDDVPPPYTGVKY